MFRLIKQNVLFKKHFSLSSLIHAQFEINSKSDYDTKILQSTRPVLGFFFAPWCGHCQRVKPIMQKIIDQNKDIDVGLINVDENAAIVKELGLENIPAVFFYSQGTVTKKLIGHMEQVDIENQIKVLLKNKK